MANLVYFLDGKPYINLTNACTNACLFCVRDIKDDVVGADLRINESDAKASDVISQIEESKEQITSEIVFCGYGEPLVKLDTVVEVSEYIKENLPNVKIRINTNGHASYIHKKNVPEILKGLIDSVSISLNAQNEELYNKISQPKFDGAYDAMLEFAKLCVESGIDTTLSVVKGYNDNEFDVIIEDCALIAANVGAKLRVREWIENGY